MATARIGTSGWAYAHWRERFYPRGLSPRDYLPYYSQHFDTVEINRSFYRLPTREQFQRWADLTPPGFVFAVKASRLITHVQRLADVREPLAQLLGAASGLGPKLGPVLFQLPPSLAVDLERLDAFLALLPGGVRCVFEFRHPSWLVPAVFERLRAAGCALCWPVHPVWPLAREVTSDFTYIRFHASRAGASFPDEELRAWAGEIGGLLARGLAVYAYFNNDINAYAVANARTLRALLAASLDPAERSGEGRSGA